MRKITPEERARIGRVALGTLKSCAPVLVVDAALERARKPKQPPLEPLGPGPLEPDPADKQG